MVSKLWTFLNSPPSRTTKVALAVIGIGVIALTWPPRKDPCPIDEGMPLADMIASYPRGYSHIPKGFVIERRSVHWTAIADYGVYIYPTKASEAQFAKAGFSSYPGSGAFCVVKGPDGSEWIFSQKGGRGSTTASGYIPRELVYVDEDLPDMTKPRP